jgi:hypothetical protein
VKGAYLIVLLENVSTSIAPKNLTLEIPATNTERKGDGKRVVPNREYQEQIPDLDPAIVGEYNMFEAFDMIVDEDSIARDRRDIGIPVV